MDKSELLSLIQETFAPNIAELVAAMMLPVVMLAPAPDAEDSLTFTGGAPVMSAEIPWPMPLARDERLADTWTAEYYQTGKDRAKVALPLSFMAQVDLATLPDLAVSSELPREGRLLFFFNPMSGAFELGPRFSRVIWDKSPAETVVPHQTPEALLMAELEERIIFEEVMEAYRLPEKTGISGLIDRLLGRAPDLATDDPVPAFFVVPKQTARLAEGAIFPDRRAYEAEPTYSRILGDLIGDDAMDFEESYFDLIHESEFFPYMLGPPIPEQDDPRFHTAGEALNWKGKREEREAAARHWTLLLQVQFTHWYGRESDGTVYFLIHEDDLKARRFEAVFAVYQQT
ncbi:MAG: DUF1963 domain-containing protein [Maritimibacter sp.]